LTVLEGFEAPAGAWETEILASRLEGYEPAWLDAHCIAGRAMWARLTPPGNRKGRGRAATPVRSTPIALLDRRRLPLWISLLPQASTIPPSPRAQLLLDCLHVQGALFFEELAEASHLLRPQVEEALGELVALGLVTSDSFAGLRGLLVPSNQRRPIPGAKRRGRIPRFDIESGGRWALIRRALSVDDQSRVAAVERVARAWLQRYGVVFWRLLTREANWLPPWRDLLRVYRRLEARGEIRGGRFVAGFSGEQYALPEAIGLLRETRRRVPSEQWISLSGADPLNLIGVLAALTDNRLVYRDGIPVAILSAGTVEFLTTLDTKSQWEAQKRLMRSAARGLLSHLS